MNKLKPQNLRDLDTVSLFSHQIKNILSTLKINTKFLKQNITYQQRKQTVEMIEEELNRIIQLTSDILEFKKIQSDSAHLHSKWCQWDHIIQKVQKNLLPLLKQANIQLEKTGQQEEKGIEIYVNQTGIEQVLTNLICNAIEHSPSNSKIKLVWKITTSNKFSVRILDQGKGMTEQEMEKIFTPFYSNGRNKLNKSNKSHGLGLTIAQQILRSHNSFIQVSNHPAGGAYFTFILPQARKYT